MATISRSDVIDRAWKAYADAGYYWGGDYRISSLHVAYLGDASTHKNPNGNNEAYGSKTYARYPVAPDPSSPYIGTDCSGFCGWAWALSYKHGSTAWSPKGEFRNLYRPRSGTTHTYADFPGIQAGDVLSRDGHVALYLGGDMVLEYNTKNWLSTGNKRGGNYRTIAESESYKSFTGYCSFDNTYSSEYNPDEGEVPDDYKPAGGGSNSNNNGVTDGYYPDVSESYPPFALAQYTKRYSLMKHYRSI